MTGTLLFIVLAVGAPALKSPSAQDVGLVGEWELVARIVGGKPEPAPGPPRAFILTYGPDGNGQRRQGDDPPDRDFRYVIDATAHPMTLDEIHRSAGKPTVVRKSIFKVDNDTLTVCMAAGLDGDRPTSFESTRDPTTWLYTFKRVRKKD